MPSDNKVDDRSEKSNLATSDNSASNKMSNEIYQTGTKMDVPRNSSNDTAHQALPELSIVDSSSKSGAAATGDKPTSGAQSSVDGKQGADSSTAKNNNSDSTDSSSQNSAVDGLNATLTKFEKDVTQATETLGNDIQAFTSKLAQVLEPYNSQGGPNFQNTQNNFLNDWMGRSSKGSDGSSNSSWQNFQPTFGSDAKTAGSPDTAVPSAASNADWSSRMASQGFQPAAFGNNNESVMQQFAAGGMNPQNFNFNPSLAGQLSSANDGVNSSSDVMSPAPQSTAAQAAATGADWSTSMADKGFQPGAFTNNNESLMKQFADSGMTPQNFNFSPAAAAQLSAANDGTSKASGENVLQGGAGNDQSSSSSSATPSFDTQSFDTAPISQTASMNNFQNNNLNSWFGQPASGDSSSLSSALPVSADSSNLAYSQPGSIDSSTLAAAQSGQTNDAVGNVIQAGLSETPRGDAPVTQNSNPTPAGNDKSQEVISTNDVMRNYLDQSANMPRPDGGLPASAPQNATGTPTDRVVTSVGDDQKVNQVSSYNAKDNTWSQYNLDSNQNVQSRSVTNLNDNSVDTVKYDANQQPISHQITKDGQTFDAAVDTNQAISTTRDPEGNLQGLTDRKIDGSASTQIGFDQGKATSQTNTSFGQGNTFSDTKETLDANGVPSKTSINSLDDTGLSKNQTFDNSGNSKTIETKGNYTATATVDENGKTFAVKDNTTGNSYETNVDPSGRQQTNTAINGTTGEFVRDTTSGGVTTTTSGQNGIDSGESTVIRPISYNPDTAATPTAENASLQSAEVAPNISVGTGKGPGEMTPGDLQAGLNKSGNPQPDGGYVSPKDAAPASTTASTATDQVQTTVDDNGKVTEVGSYNASDNTLSQYKIGQDGNVESRSVTNMNDGSVDTVNYGVNQEPISHQITKDGATTDAPIDSSDQVSTTLNSEGGLQSIETRKSDSGSSISFDGDGNAVKQNSMTLGNGQASTVVNQNLGADGKPTTSTVENRDESGALRSTVATDGTQTTTKSYDDNQALVKTDITDTGVERVITPTDTGSKEVLTRDNGVTVTTIKNNDGSSAQATVDSVNNTSEISATNADKSTYDLKTNAQGAEQYKETQPDGYTYERVTSDTSDKITVTDKDGLHSYENGDNGQHVTEIKPDHSSYELQIDPNGDQKETVVTATGDIATSETKNGVTTESTGQGKVATTDVSYNPDAANGTPAAGSPAPTTDTPAPVADTPAPTTDTPAPVADTPAPTTDTPAPVADTPAPVADTPAPVADTPAPVVDTPAPVADTPAPVADVATPIVDNQPVNPMFDTTPTFDATPTFDTTPAMAPLPDPVIEAPQIPVSDPVSPVDTSSGSLDMSNSIEPAMSSDSSYSDGGGE